MLIIKCYNGSSCFRLKYRTQPSRKGLLMYRLFSHSFNINVTVFTINLQHCNCSCNYVYERIANVHLQTMNELSAPRYIMSMIVSSCQHCNEQFQTLSCVHYTIFSVVKLFMRVLLLDHIFVLKKIRVCLACILFCIFTHMLVMTLFVIFSFSYPNIKLISCKEIKVL